MDLAAQIENWANEALQGETEYFVVEILRSKTGKQITVILDGDQGIPIQKCGEVSRFISRKVDEEVPDEVGAFTVEVSSPGVDRPLKMIRQFAKHLGRSLRFMDEEGKEQEGVFKALDGETLNLEMTIKEKGKKKQVVERTYNLSSITDPKVVVSFKR
ncbi:MAG: hypothetical protein EP332_09795 [Bacteroidetes bacterium]|nr:MAG: hypothetical protein EP332_09795 [Bacteroidota bacterium]